MQSNVSVKLTLMFCAFANTEHHTTHHMLKIYLTVGIKLLPIYDKWDGFDGAVDGEPEVINAT